MCGCVLLSTIYIIKIIMIIIHDVHRCSMTGPSIVPQTERKYSIAIPGGAAFVSCFFFFFSADVNRIVVAVVFFVLCRCS